MSQTFEQALTEMLEDPKAKERMLEIAATEMEERIREQFRWSLPDVVAQECNDFIKEHVAPEVRAHLLAKKGPIVEAAKKSADQVGEKIAAALVDKIDDKMGESWTQRKILEALFS